MSTAGLRRGLSPPLKHGRSMSSDEVLRFLPVQSGLADPVVAAAAAGRTPQWVFPDASPSHTADYPAAAPSPRVDPAVHVQRLIEALTRDKNALEQLHLEGQLENAQLRSQVQEIADAFKEALADNAPQECERCGHLWREIEAGRKEAARLRAELLDAATEAEAHKLRYDIFVRDAAAASDAAAARAAQLEAEKAALDAAFAEERRRADARAAALEEAVARAEQEQERLRGQASGLAKEVEAGAAAEAARARAAAAAGEAEDEARRRHSASLEERLGSEEQRRRAAEAERDKLLAELKQQQQQQQQQPLPPAPWEAADSPRTSQKHHAEAVDMHRRLAALEVEVAHAKRASADLEAQRKDLEEARSAAEVELRSALIDKAGLTGELNALRELAAAKESGGDGGAAADDAASLRKRLTAAEAKLEAAVEDNARLEATLLSACQERDAIGGEVSTMRRQVTSLSAQMQAVEQARGALAAEVDAAKAETARKQADGAHLEVELKVTQERLRNGVDTQERLTAKVASLKEKLKGHEAEKEELYRLKEKLKYSEHEAGRIAAEKDEVVERHRAAVMEAEMQARRVEGLRLEMEALDSQHESMRTTHSDLETSLRANTEQRTTLEERVEELQQQILKSKESEGSLNSSLSSLQGELEVTQTKAEKKRRKLEERLRELEEELAAQKKHADSALTALESDVLAGDGEHAGDGGDVAAASGGSGAGTLDARVRNLLARVRRERSAASAAVSDASGAVASLEEQLQSAQAKANQANLSALSLKEEVSSASVRLEQRASEAVRAQEEAAALQATLSEVRARAQKEDAQSRERLEQLSGSLALIQEELELERGQRSALQAREAALAAQVAALQGKLEGCEGAGALNDELKADVERLQTQLAEEQQRSADAEAAKKDAAAAEAARSEAARAAEAATQKVDDLCLVRTALSHELMAEKKKAERAEEAQAEAQAARTVLEEACQAQKAQLTALAEENTASRIAHSKEIAALKDTLRNANEAVATERGRTSAEAGMRLHTHAEMESELMLAKQQLDTSMKERAALQGRCDTLADQLSSTREALGRLRPNTTPSVTGLSPSKMDALDRNQGGRGAMESADDSAMPQMMNDLRAAHAEIEMLRHAAAAAAPASAVSPSHLTLLQDENLRLKDEVGRLALAATTAASPQLDVLRQENTRLHTDLAEAAAAQVRMPMVEAENARLREEGTKFVAEISRVMANTEALGQERDKAVHDNRLLQDEIAALHELVDEYRTKLADFEFRIQAGVEAAMQDLQQRAPPQPAHPVVPPGTPRADYSQPIYHASVPQAVDTAQPGRAFYPAQHYPSALSVAGVPQYPPAVSYPSSPVSSVSSSPLLARAASPSRLVHT